MKKKFSPKPLRSSQEAKNNNNNPSYPTIIPSWSIFKAYLLQTLREVQRRKVNFALGACSCFIVVLVVAFMITLLTNSPVVFLRLAELNSGEMDIVMNSGDWTGFSSLNYTLLEDELKVKKDWTYHTPRISGDVASKSL